jgi:hypothetical protein
MKIWTATKRLNQRYDAWATRAANKVVDGLDHRGADSGKPEIKKHISVWDLLPNHRDPGRSRGDAMRLIGRDWKAWSARIVDDFRSPARISALTWLSLLVCGVLFLAWLMS